MTPKEKAKELIKKCGSYYSALVLIEEVLYLFSDNHHDSRYCYYEAVKQEIEKL